jgi:mono/diheme cytochrome c family protein
MMLFLLLCFGPHQSRRKSIIGNDIMEHMYREDRRRRRKIILALIAIVLVTLLTWGVNLGLKSVGGMEGIELMTRWLNGHTLQADFKTERPMENEKNRKAGKTVYHARCAVCHGIEGKGNGVKSGLFKTPPTDFSSGLYKFRSTTGNIPHDDDLYKTISRGLHGTGMLPWPGLTSMEKWQLVYYIKTFSDIFDDAEAPVFINIPAPISSKPQYIRMGKELYNRAKCYECHGYDGDGKGEKAGSLKDDWGRPISPKNFRKDRLKRGTAIPGIYLTIAAGLDGTPMQSQGKVLTQDDMLAVAYYIQSIAVRPKEDGPLSAFLNGTDDERLAIGIDHVLMPTGVRAKYFAWMF